MVSPFKKALHPIALHTRTTWSEKFVAGDGQVLRARVFEPHDQPRDTILFFHGVAAAPSGKEAYKVLFHYLNREGFRVIAVDQRGHGRTHADFDVDKMQQDVVDILKSLKKKGITVREGPLWRRKKRSVKLSNVQIAAHSMGSVIAASGLLKAHQQSAVIPEISGFFAYAPPWDMKSLPITREIYSYLERLKGKPRRVANIIASVAYPLKTDRFTRPAKLGIAVWSGARSLLSGRVHADDLKLRTVAQFQEQVDKVPNFTSVLAQLQRANASPRFSLVWLGTRDSDTETRNPSERRRYAMHLRIRGVNVKAIPFTHHPNLNPASRFNIFKFSERIAKDIASISRAAERPEVGRRASLAPPEPK